MNAAGERGVKGRNPETGNTFTRAALFVWLGRLSSTGRMARTIVFGVSAVTGRSCWERSLNSRRRRGCWRNGWTRERGWCCRIQILRFVVNEMSGGAPGWGNYSGLDI